MGCSKPNKKLLNRWGYVSTLKLNNIYRIVPNFSAEYNTDSSRYLGIYGLRLEARRNIRKLWWLIRVRSVIIGNKKLVAELSVRVAVQRYFWRRWSCWWPSIWSSIARKSGRFGHGWKAFFAVRIGKKRTKPQQIRNGSSRRYIRAKQLMIP